MSFAEMNMSLENFVKRFQLPHSAKVIEGYQGEYDVEFSTGEVLMVYRAAYPLSVSLTLNDPPPAAGKAKQVSISVVNDNVRFHVVSRYKEPRIFRSVKEVIDAWPLTIKSLTDDVTGDGGGGGGGTGSGSGLRYRRHDQLRLLGSRLHQTDSTVLLECHLARTRQTVLLSEHDRGEFLEVADQQSFTVQELVDLPRATRTLRLDASARGSSYPCGIPANYGGTLTMNRPDVKVQIARVLEGDLDDNVTLSDPVLVPVDCNITLAPRDEVYRQDNLFLMHSLRGIVENDASQFPFVVRVVQVIRTSTVLLIHTVHTNDLVVIFARKPVHKILSHCGNRYFLVPVTHQGCFVAADDGGSNERLDLAQLGAASFPMHVRYAVNDYANVIEDLPSDDDVIAFDALVDDDVSAVAAKIFDENVGSAFHVSLSGANVKVQRTNWRGKLHRVPAKMSPYADCSEEISAERYNEIMELSAPKPKPQLKPMSGSSSGRRVPQPPKLEDDSRLQKARHPDGSTNLASLPVCPPKKKPPAAPSSASLRPPQLPSRKDTCRPIGKIKPSKPSQFGQKPETTHRPGGAPTNALKIPEDGNVRHFNVDQMSEFLKEIKVADDVIEELKDIRFDGEALSHMTDRALQRYGLDNSVFRFFRDNSKTS